MSDDKANGKDKYNFGEGITIVISPQSPSTFACGIDKSYEDDTAEKTAVKTIALGLCELALHQPDMVFEVGLKVRSQMEANLYDADIDENNNIVDIEEWLKKFKKPTLN